MNIKDIITESQHKCPHCGGPVVEYSELMEKKDACYYKVKASAKVWPSAYASGRLVQCRKKGAGNYGNKSEGVTEGSEQEFNKIKTSYDQASRMFSGEETQGFTIEVLLPNEAAFKKIQDTFKMFENQIGTYLIEKEDSIEGNGIGAMIISPLRQGARNAQKGYNLILDLIQKSRGQFNNSTGVTIYKRPQGVAEQQLDEKCWDTHKQVGMKNKGGRQVPDCRPKESVAEDADNKCPPATQDIALNLKNRQKAIDDYGYGPLNPDMPNTKFWMKKVDEWNLDSAEEAKQSLCGNCAAFDIRQHTLDCIAQGIDSDSPADAAGVIDAGELGYCKFLKFKCASRRTCDAWVTGGPLRDKPNAEEGLTEEFDLIESIIEGIAEQNGVDAEAVWEDLESLTEDELYAFAVTSQLNEDWQKANKKDRTAGMSQKAVNAYRRENPGSKLKTAVTTKPSKLKRGSKASKRRKSYCSRSRGQMKMHNISCAKTPDKAICKARRRWNC
jgi:hypothetical protein